MEIVAGAIFLFTGDFLQKNSNFKIQTTQNQLLKI